MRQSDKRYWKAYYGGNDEPITNAIQCAILNKAQVRSAIFVPPALANLTKKTIRRKHMVAKKKKKRPTRALEAELEDTDTVDSEVTEEESEENA